MTPLIGVPGDRKRLNDAHYFHVVGEKYLLVIAEVAGATPLMIPALGAGLDLEAVLARLDGLLITGAHSDIEPHHYGAAEADPAAERDPARDTTNLQLIPAAIDRGMPVLGICRGLQELNVALGGTLHQRLHEQPGRMDHREPRDAPLDVQYGPAHSVGIVPGGLLADWLSSAGAVAPVAGQSRGTVMVNSLHGQGIDRLAGGLRVEAQADDGSIEAVSLPAAPGLVFAVQWHPEWRPHHNPLSQAIFSAFGAACRGYAERRAEAPTAGAL